MPFSECFLPFSAPPSASSSSFSSADYRHRRRVPTTRRVAFSASALDLTHVGVKTGDSSQHQQDQIQQRQRQQPRSSSSGGGSSACRPIDVINLDNGFQTHYASFVDLSKNNVVFVSGGQRGGGSGGDNGSSGSVARKSRSADSRPKSEFLESVTNRFNFDFASSTQPSVSSCASKVPLSPATPASPASASSVQLATLPSTSVTSCSTVALTAASYRLVTAAAPTSKCFTSVFLPASSSSSAIAPSTVTWTTQTPSVSVRENATQPLSLPLPHPAPPPPHRPPPGCRQDRRASLGPIEHFGPGPKAQGGLPVIKSYSVWNLSSDGAENSYQNLNRFEFP